MRFILLLITGVLLNLQCKAQQTQADTLIPTLAKKKWFETFSIRGYVQARYNKIGETNSQLGCEQCDKSWGGDGGFFLRRIRIIFYGQISERVYFYVQPDFASSVSSGSLHFAQLRDAYFDIGIDRKNQVRFRIGQSKIPYGFENMQSSQNRLPLDRNDALNSAIANERDLGVFLYIAPLRIRKLFSSLVKEGLKGTGDYGMIGLGVYNGQTANRPDLNKNRHIVGRFTYPLELGNQIIEPAIQGYTGKYVIEGGRLDENNIEYTDERVAGTFVLYPKPFGIQAEYNIGRGPEYNKFTDSTEIQNLKGGYVTFSYLKNFKTQVLIPFVRYHFYQGGKKHELDARSYHVEELEVGFEWQPVPQFEFVAHYTFSARRYEDSSNRDNYQRGSLLRMQAQINF